MKDIYKPTSKVSPRLGTVSRASTHMNAASSLLRVPCAALPWHNKVKQLLVPMNHNMNVNIFQFKAHVFMIYNYPFIVETKR